MRVKRLILILSALTMVVALAACGSPEGATDGGDRRAPEKKEAPKKTSEKAEDKQVASKKKVEDSGKEEGTIVDPASDETLKLTVPEMERVKNVTVPTAVPDQEALRNNVAVRLPGTGLPWEEEANVYIAGHELGYPFTPSFRAFYDLKELEEGDEIYITDADGRRYTYEVFEVLIVQPTDLWVLEPLEGKNIVSLQGSETQRQVGDNIPKRVVRAELKDVEE
jgi:sortase A